MSQPPEAFDDLEHERRVRAVEEAMANSVCWHGQLRRSCEICERDDLIITLQSSAKEKK